MPLVFAQPVGPCLLHSSQARGALLGLSLSHTPEQVARSVFEGLVMEARRVVEEVLDAYRFQIEQQGFELEVSIAEDLPERHIVWRLVQDHVNPELMFAGTEFGVFFTVDGGEEWIRLAGNAPTISFRDLAIQQRENDLVAASFGRGFWILDDYSPLREVSAEALEQDSLLFPVRDAPWYIPSMPLGYWEENGKASQGDAYFVAPNSPFGAVFTYYLKDELKTAEARRQAEMAVRVVAGLEGAWTPNPTKWDMGFFDMLFRLQPTGDATLLQCRPMCRTHFQPGQKLCGVPCGICTERKQRNNNAIAAYLSHKSILLPVNYR